MTITSLAITATGIGGTIYGFLDLRNGRIVEGAKAIFLAASFANLGGRLKGLDSESHSNL